jgi:hypothetical protein
MALDPLTAGIDLAKTVVQTIWPDKSESERAQLAAAVSMVQGQLAVNQAEASNPSIFVSGWRPFIGWVCGGGCAWNWVGLPIAKFGIAAAGLPALQIAQADFTEMMPLLLGLLGLGGLRTYERVKGVHRE